MQRNYFKTSAVLLLLGASLLTTGCVTGRRSVPLTVPTSAAPAKATKGTAFVSTVTDDRVFENKPKSPATPSIDGDVTKLTAEAKDGMIGRQRNGYGKAMGDVALGGGQTVTGNVRELVGQGLKQHGYTLVPGPTADKVPTVSVTEFWGWFSPGFASVSFEAKVGAELTFGSGASAKRVVVKGYGVNKGQVASDANWQLAYSRAFDDFLKNLDKALSGAGL